LNTSIASVLSQAAAAAAGGQQYPAGSLYVVATPIGNLADLSLRAIHVLGLVDAVACEDTRQTQKLLAVVGVTKPLERLDAHTAVKRLEAIVSRLTETGESVALVTDAGTPGVSDPAAAFVRAAREGGVEVVPVPGVSAVTALLSVAGFLETPFTFCGFFPRKKG
jgi:16S rRNA (cytidine1402-2'-O)-methyltransferase